MLALAPTELDRAAALLVAGRLVGVPTDTVYGLAAAFADDAAIDSLFAAKHRPDSMPIAVLCGSTDEAATLATEWSEHAALLARRFWPGPLTLVVRAAAPLCRRVRAEHGVGVRVPDDPTCLGLLARTGPLAVTSANLHGGEPATTATAVSSTFDDPAVAAVIDDGPRDGVVSTVVDLTGDSPLFLRVGALSREELLGAISEG